MFVYVLLGITLVHNFLGPFEVKYEYGKAYKSYHECAKEKEKYVSTKFENLFCQEIELAK